MTEILDVDLLAFERGTAGPAAGGRRRRAAQPRDRLRVHPPRPVRGPPRHGLRDARRVLRGPARGQAALGQRRAPTARPATRACSSRRRRRATSRTGRRCSTGRRRSRRATRCAQVPARLPRPGAARGDRPGHHQGALRVPRHDRRPAAAVPAGDRRGHRVPRVVLRRDGHGRADADPGHPLPTDAARSPTTARTSGPASTATST